MSAASLLKVYDGLDPELAFQTAGPGGNQDLAQVLAVGASANNVAMTDLGDLTFGTGSIITGPVGTPFQITSNNNTNLLLTGSADCLVSSTSGSLTLDAPDAAGELILVLNANKLSVAPLNAAVNGPTYVGAVRQLKIQVGNPAVDYYIALNPAPFA